MNNKLEFAAKMQARTKTFAVQIVKFYGKLPKTDEAVCLAVSSCGPEPPSPPTIVRCAVQNQTLISFTNSEQSWRKQTRVCSGSNCSMKPGFVPPPKRRRSRAKRTNSSAFFKHPSTRPNATPAVDSLTHSLTQTSLIANE